MPGGKEPEKMQLLLGALRAQGNLLRVLSLSLEPPGASGLLFPG